MGLFSCGGESTEKPQESTQESEQQEVQNQEKEEEDEEVIWYEGEAPTDLDKLKLYSDFLDGKKQFDLCVTFTEPFWTFYFFGNEVLFNASDFDIPEVHPIEYPFAEDEIEQALSFMRNGEFWQFKVKKEPGSDGMSDIVYEYSVKLDQFEGGGSRRMVNESGF